MKDHEVLELYWKLEDAPIDESKIDLTVASKGMGVFNIGVEAVMVDREAGVLMARFKKGQYFTGFDLRRNEE